MKRCPTCGQPIEKKSGRVCFLCGLQILKHHKFYFEEGRVRHRVCSNPTVYTDVPGNADPPPLMAAEVTGA